MVNQWVLLGYLLEQKWLRDKHHQSLPQHCWDESSQNLGTWSPLHSLQAVQHVRECPFQLTHLSKPLPGSNSKDHNDHSMSNDALLILICLQFLDLSLVLLGKIYSTKSGYSPHPHHYHQYTAGFCFFQAAGLAVTEVSLKLGLSESNSQQFGLFTFWDKETSESGQFKGLLKLLRFAFLPPLRSFPEGWDVPSNLGENHYTAPGNWKLPF